jgi:hypothetical protein
MVMLRPLPLAACVQFARSGQEPHASGSKWIAGLEVLHLSCGAGDGFSAHVDAKVGL